MKFLFKLIVIPVLSLAAVPAIFLGLTYRSFTIPYDDFEGANAVSLVDMVYEEVDNFLIDNNTDSTIGLHWTQQNVNSLLKEAYVSMNPLYLSETATDDEKDFVVKEEMFGYQGSWVQFSEDTVAIESGLQVFVKGFTYKTVVLISFKLTIDTEEIVLTLDKLNVGNLPLAWTFSTASWAAEQVMGQDIQTIINEQLGGIATFNPETLEIRLDVQAAVDEALSEDPQTSDLVNSLLQFIAQNDLLSIKFTEGAFNVDLALGKLRDTTTPFMLDDADRIITEADLETIMASKASSLVFSTLSTTDYPFVELNELTLNRILEYFMRDSLVSSGVLQQMTIEEQYSITVYAPYIRMNDNIVVHIPILIEDVSNPENNFPTIIKIAATPEIDGSDLKIVFNDLTAGEISLSEEYITNILALLGDSPFIVDGAFVIDNFDSLMSQTGMGLQSVQVVGDKLRLYVLLNESIDLVEIQNMVNDVLVAIVDNPEYPAELNTAINDVLDSVADPLADPEVAIENLITVFESLTDEEQTAVYEDLLTAFEGTDYDLNDILGLLP